MLTADEVLVPMVRDEVETHLGKRIGEDVVVTCTVGIIEATVGAYSATYEVETVDNVFDLGRTAADALFDDLMDQLP